MENNSNEIKMSQKPINLLESFDISFEDRHFSIELSTGEKEKSEAIIFKAYEKSNVSKFIFTNSFSKTQILETSKAFKICDDFSEILELILQKFKDNEIILSLKDNLLINFELTLPNKKVDKISFILLKEKIKESELIEKLYENIKFLSEKNKELQDQITKLSSKKKSKSCIEIMEKKFKVSKILLENDLFKSLESFDLKEDYLKEIGNKFNSKTKLIYNIKKDADTFSCVMTKVFGKNNLAGLFTFYTEEEGMKIFCSQFILLDGKLEFENGSLNFLTNTIFSYGNFEKDEFDYLNFRDNNTKILLKIEKTFAYFIVFTSMTKVRYMIKLYDNFSKKPLFISYSYYESINMELKDIIDLFEVNYKNQYEDKKNNENDNKEKDKIAKNNDKEEKQENNDKEDKKMIIKKYYIDELKIYQIDG